MSTEINEGIDLDVDTQGDLRELFRVATELQTRIQLLVRTYVKAKGKEGDYQINKDFTKLEKVENGT